MLMAANVCNYVYQLVMGRMLSVEDYGVLNALFAVMVIATVPGTAISLIVTRYIAGYNAMGEQSKIGIFLRKTLFYVSIFAAVVMAAGLALSPLIGSYLKVDDIFSVFMVVAAIVLMYLLTVSTGAVQGLKRFWSLGFLYLITPVARLVLGIILVLWGFRLNGVLGALAIGTLAAVTLGFIVIRKEFRLTGQKSMELSKREALKYCIPVLTATLCISILTNIDMIMIKHYFSAVESGAYGAAVIFGRAIYYFPMAVALAMFPLVAEAKALNEDAYSSLKKALLYSGILCGLGVVVLNLFPDLIINIFFGSRYLPAVPYIKLVSLAMLPMCLLSILVNFNLAMNKTKLTIWSMVLGCVVEYLLIIRYHADITQVLYVLIGTGLVLLVVNLIGTMMAKPERVMTLKDSC